MDATRASFGSLVEWILAAACIVAILALGSIAVREFRTVAAVTPVIANEAALPIPAAAVPPRVISVPVLLLPNGVELRIGDLATEVASRLGAQAEVAVPSIDRTAAGERVTRFYEQAATRFVVVFEPFAGDVQVRVTAIYLQSPS
jgi:hypothetical protein